MPRATRRGFTFIDENGERTITVAGTSSTRARATTSRGWSSASLDGVYFTAGDVSALGPPAGHGCSSRRRGLATLRRAGVEIGRTGGKRGGPRRAVPPGDLEPPPRLVVSTASPLEGGPSPAAPSGLRRSRGQSPDAYGAGDSFAAGLTYALASGLDRDGSSTSRPAVGRPR